MMPGQQPATDCDPLFLMEQRVTALQTALVQLRNEAVVLDNVRHKQVLGACILDTAVIRGQLSAARCDRNALSIRASHG